MPLRCGIDPPLSSERREISVGKKAVVYDLHRTYCLSPFYARPLRERAARDLHAHADRCGVCWHPCTWTSSEAGTDGPAQSLPAPGLLSRSPDHSYGGDQPYSCCDEVSCRS